jgi:hypothetical protein
MQAYNRKRPQTGGNAQQLNISTGGTQPIVINPEKFAMKKMQSGSNIPYNV